jgi:hypothetical protein
VADDEPLVCRLDVFDADQRDRHAALLHLIWPERQDVEEVDDGYDVMFRPDPALFQRLAEWITLERRCCPFLDFALGFTNDSIRLTLSGPPGVKTFLAAELGNGGGRGPTPVSLG